MFEKCQNLQGVNLQGISTKAEQQVELCELLSSARKLKHLRIEPLRSLLCWQSLVQLAEKFQKLQQLEQVEDRYTTFNETIKASAVLLTHLPILDFCLVRVTHIGVMLVDIITKWQSLNILR